MHSRDTLALERTQLANERTLLAYVRTSLSLFAAAAVLLQFFTSLHAYSTIAWVLAVCGFCILLTGIMRFYQVRMKLGKKSNAT